MRKFQKNLVHFYSELKHAGTRLAVAIPSNCNDDSANGTFVPVDLLSKSACSAKVAILAKPSAAFKQNLRLIDVHTGDYIPQRRAGKYLFVVSLLVRDRNGEAYEVVSPFKVGRQTELFTVTFDDII